MKKEGIINVKKQKPKGLPVTIPPAFYGARLSRYPLDKTCFFSQLCEELKIDAYLFKNLLIAFFMNLLTKMLFNQEGVGWLLNLISDVYLASSSILLCALHIKKGLKHLLKS